MDQPTSWTVLAQPFGRYQLLRRLGAGGMAEVFLAREPLPGGLSKILVLKKIRPPFARSPTFQRMFEQEAKIAVNLNHPCVVHTFGYGQIDGVLYLTMEHVDGIDLLRLLHLARAQNLPPPPALWAYIAAQVCQGLDYAHRKLDERGEPLSIVHRDISPQNVLLSWDGAVKLADFGIARARDTQEDSGLLKGKYAYMSPEQASGGPVDRRSDLFSLGIVLWEVLTGRALFGALPMHEALAAICAGRVPRPRDVCPQVPPALEEIVLRALQVRPEDRYQTARDLHRDLLRFYFLEAGRTGEVMDAGRLAAYLARLVPPSRRPALLDPMSPEPSSWSGSGPTGSLPGPLPESRTHLRERHGVLVVEGVFHGLDRVRSTLGPRQATAALEAVQRAADQAAREHRAQTARIDESGFTFLLGLPREQEHDAQEAIQLALEQREALARMALPLEVAIGIHRGTALVPRRLGAPVDHKPTYQVTADTLAAARTLARTAQAGEILVDSSVYRAVRGSWRFLAVQTQVGPTPATWPGRAPSRAYRLLSASPRAEQTERPVPLVGRQAELAQLAEALRSSEQRPQRVLVIGEPGIGKRTLLAAFRHSLDPSRYLALHAAVPASQRSVPLALLADLARDMLGLGEQADGAEVGRHLEAARRMLCCQGRDGDRIVSSLRLLLNSPMNPPLDLHPLRTALQDLLQHLLGPRRLVLTVAETQWADLASLTLLDELRRDGLLGLCVYAGRPWAEWPSELRALLGQQDCVIALRGLGTAEQEELILSRFAPGARQEALPLCRRIIAKADGNAFYINEILDGLLDRGALVLEPDGLRCIDPEPELPIPASVEAAVAARLDRLPGRQRDCLVLLSLCQHGMRPVDPEVLAGILAHDPAGELSQLAEAGLVACSEEGGWAIRSPLVQEVVAASLPLDDRLRLQEELLLLLAGDAPTRIGHTHIACDVSSPRRTTESKEPHGAETSSLSQPVPGIL